VETSISHTRDIEDKLEALEGAIKKMASDESMQSVIDTPDSKLVEELSEKVKNLEAALLQAARQKRLVLKEESKYTKGSLHDRWSQPTHATGYLGRQRRSRYNDMRR